MNTLVLFESKYGSTQKYAEDIASRVGADIFPLKKFRWKNLKNYETVLFGGWVRGGTIVGIDKFLQHWDKMSEKNVLVFASGMSMADQNTRALLIEQNLLDMYHLRFYQLRGSFDYQKLKFPDNLLISQSLRTMAADPSNASEIAAFQSLKTTPIESYDDAKVDKICSVIETLKLKERQ